MLRKPAGAPPGTLMVADPAALAPRLHVMAYDADRFVDRPLAKPDEMREVLEGQWSAVWLNVDGLGDAPTVARIGELFGLHPLALEDVLNVRQRAKVDQFPGHLFMVMREVSRRENTLETEQFSLFLGRNFVVTFQEHPGDALDPVRDRIRRASGRIRERGPDYLAYSIIDAVIDSYFPILETYGELLDDMEDDVIFNPTPDCVRRIHDVKRDLLTLRRAAWPLRDAVNALARDVNPFVIDDTKIYLRDCYDHTINIIDLLENHRELGSSMMEEYLSSISQRMNEIMKVLTIISTIFIPLNFIVGVYGMNFDTGVSAWNMPELHWRYGYLGVWAVLLAVAAGLLVYFRRKGWIGQRDALPERRAENGEARLRDDGSPRHAETASGSAGATNHRAV